MTVTRLGQVTAETGSQGEFLRDGGNSWELSNTIVHSGNYSWHVSNKSGLNIPGMGIGFPEQVGVRGNFALYQGPLGAYGYYLLRIDAGAIAGIQAGVFLDADNSLIFQIEGVTQATLSQGTTGFTLSQWQNIGFFYKSGSPGTFTFYIDGATIYTYSGTLSGTIDSVFLASSAGNLFRGTGHSYYDDFYVDGITLDEIDAAPSSRRFLPSSPTVASSVQWIPVGAGTNLGCVNEAIADDDDTYVKTLLSDKQDLYQMQSVALPTDYKIRAVIPTAIARKGDTGVDARIAMQLFDGLNLVQDDSKPTFVSYRQVWGRFASQPDNSQWTEGDYASMIAGYVSGGAF